MVALEKGDRLDDVCDPLPGDDPPQLEDERLIDRESESTTCNRLVARREFGRVDATWDDRDPARVGAVETDEIVLVLRALGDGPIRLGHDGRFDVLALGRERVRCALMERPDLAESMERDDERGPRAAPHLRPHAAAP